MKFSAKLCCLLLCLLMLVPMVVACGNQADTGPADLGGTNSNGGQNNTNKPSDGDDSHTDHYSPSGNRYDGQSFVVLLSNKAGDFVDVFEFAEENPTIIDSAVQRKNELVTTDYGVVFETVRDAGNNNTGAQKMSQSYNSGDVSYDLSFIDSYSIVPLASQGVLYDLNKIDAIDLNNSWWDQRANTDLSIQGQMYFTTGDIDIWDDMQQFIMMFNRTEFDKANLKYTVDEFYTLAEEGKWTYDEFYELGKGFNEDVDGNDKMDGADKYGMITWDDTIYSVFSSTGSKVVNNEDGSLKLGMIGDEKSINCMTTYTEWTQQNAYNYSRDGGGSKAIKMFQENRALFFMGRLQSLDLYRDMESDFGVVPVPKYTVDDDYYVTTSPYHTGFICTMGLEENIQMRGEIIEACAYYGAQELTPAYREKTLEGTNIRDEGSLMTLQLVAKNRIYDIGFYVSPGDIQKQLIILYRLWSTDFASTYEQFQAAAEQAIADVEAAYAELLNR